MEYRAPGPDAFAEQQSIDHTPAYTWVNLSLIPRSSALVF